MNLSIKMIDKKPKERWEVVTVKGKIKIGDFQEDLYPSLDWWSPDDYEHQWREGLSRLSDHEKSCFIVDINNPTNREFIEWWKLYKIDNKIYVRNSIILDDIYEEQIGDKPFTLQTCYNFIPDRGSLHDEDGNKISEWVVDWDGKIEE